MLRLISFKSALVVMGQVLERVLFLKNQFVELFED